VWGRLGRRVRRPLRRGTSPNPSAYVANPHAWCDPFGLSPYRKNLPGWDTWEPKDPTWGGRVVYSAPDAHGRPGKVTAEIHQDMLGQKTYPRPKAQSLPGWDNKAVYNRTHLLAASLGGSNAMPENFVIAHKFANHPVMFHFEDQVISAVENGHIVTYTVTPIYRYSGMGPMRPEDLRPIGLTIEAHNPQGFTFHGYHLDENLRDAEKVSWEKDPSGGFNKITILNVPKCH
jgi:hypothetical protein